ncbi:MAG: LysR substrate-binding domain-containing protein [Polyangia bacterium]
MFLFSEVAKQRSFRLAAASLKVSVSLLSRRIAALERELGQQLLLRTTRRVELTEAGARYFERCQRLVDEARAVHEQARELAAEPRGHLRIVSSIALGCSLLAPLIAEFAALYPAISIELDVSSQGVESTKQGFDLALRLGSPPDSSFQIHPLARLECHVYAAPAYLKQRGTPRHPSALAQHECVRLLDLHGESTWAFSDGREALDVAVGGRLSLTCMETLSRVVANGLGVGLIAEPIAREQVQAGRLQRILKSWSNDPYPVSALSPGRMLPARARVFLAFLRARFPYSQPAPVR